MGGLPAALPGLHHSPGSLRSGPTAPVHCRML